jgi:hypothetical protein
MVPVNSSAATPLSTSADTFDRAAVVTSPLLPDSDRGSARAHISAPIRARPSVSPHVECAAHGQGGGHRAHMLGGRTHHRVGLGAIDSEHKSARCTADRLNVHNAKMCLCRFSTWAERLGRYGRRSA